MCSKNDVKIAEKRRYVRHNCKATIEWSNFNKLDYFESKLLNFSRGGVYIETVHDLMPGATIIIRLGKVLSSKIDSADHQYPKLVSLGEVTWRTKLSEKHHSHWGVGVRYPITA